MPAVEWVDSFQIQSLAVVGLPATFTASVLDLLKEWNGVTNTGVGVIGNATARGTSALYVPFGTSLLKTISHQATYTIGMRTKTSSSAGVGGITSLFNFSNNSQILFSLLIRTDGSILLFADNNQSKVILDTGTPVITASVEAYIEVTVTISTALLTINVAAELWVNNTSYGTGNVNGTTLLANLTSQTATFNRIELNAGVTTPGGTYYSDFYILKGTGRLGQSVYPYGVQIDAIFTRSDDTPTDWTPSSVGSHWDKINENPPGTGTYVETAVSGKVDSYNWEPVSSFVGTAPSVFLKLLAKSTEEGLCQFQGNVGSGGTQDQTAIFSLGGDIDQYWCESFDVDPLTLAAWLAADFNTRPFGIQLV